MSMALRQTLTCRVRLKLDQRPDLTVTCAICLHTLCHPAESAHPCRVGGARVLLAGVALWSLGTLIAPPAAKAGLLPLCATRVLVRMLEQDGWGMLAGVVSEEKVGWPSCAAGVLLPLGKRPCQPATCSRRCARLWQKLGI